MMKDVVEKLRTDYLKNEDRILTTLRQAEKGIKPSSLFSLKIGDKTSDRGGFEKLTPEVILKLKESGKEVSREKFDFNDKEELGYSWVEKSAEHTIENRNIKAKDENGK